MIANDTPIQEQVAAHALRNLALVKRLVALGVATAVPRVIDLHFFLPSTAAAQALAGRLQLRGVQEVEIAPPAAVHPDNADAYTSLTISVLETVDAVTTHSYVQFLVEAAAQFHGVHDGWGTSVSNTTTTPR